MRDKDYKIDINDINYKNNKKWNVHKEWKKRISQRKKERHEDRGGSKENKKSAGENRDEMERVERVLATFSRSAPPDGLKEPLFRNVEKRKLRRPEPALTPGIRKAIAASLILAYLFWGADFLISRAEKNDWPFLSTSERVTSLKLVKFKGPTLPKRLESAEIIFSRMIHLSMMSSVPFPLAWLFDLKSPRRENGKLGFILK